MASTSADPIKSLLERNASWADNYCGSHASYMDTLSKGQSPKVLWLGCSDSRVPESVCCHAEPGEMFVVRNVSNQFNSKDDSVMSVLAYGVQALGIEHGGCTQVRRPEAKDAENPLILSQWSSSDTQSAAAWMARSKPQQPEARGAPTQP